MFKRILSVICIVLLLAAIVVPPPPVEAAVTETVLVSCIYSLLSAWGLNYIFAGMDSGGIVDAMIDDLTVYLSTIGETLTDWLDMAIVAADGFLGLKGAAAGRVAAFALYLQSKYELEAYGADVTTQYATTDYIGLYDGTKLPLWTNGTPVVSDMWVSNGGGTQPLRVHMSNGYWFGFMATDGHAVGVFTDGIGTQAIWTISNVFIDYALVSNRNGKINLTALSASGDLRHITLDQTQIDLLALNTDITSVTINPGDIEIPQPDSIPADTNVYVGTGIANPADTVGDIADKILGALEDNSLVVDYTITDAESPVITPVPTTAPGDGADTPGAITQVMPVWPQLDDPQSYGVSGLTEVFPFCIPFDLYYALSSLTDLPTTPVIYIPFFIPGVVDMDITIDFRDWSDWVIWFRRCELLAFGVGLMLVTRKMIKW